MKKSTTLITSILILCTGSVCIAQSSVQLGTKAEQVQMTEPSKEQILEERIARKNTSAQKNTSVVTLQRALSDEKVHLLELDKMKLKEIEEQKEKEKQIQKEKEQKTEINGDNKEKAKDSSKETHK